MGKNSLSMSSQLLPPILTEHHNAIPDIYLQVSQKMITSSEIYTLGLCLKVILESDLKMVIQIKGKENTKTK